VHDYITLLWGKQAEVKQYHKSEHVHSIDQNEARHKKYRRH
jgi:hypothetical protein